MLVDVCRKEIDRRLSRCTVQTNAGAVFGVLSLHVTCGVCCCYISSTRGNHLLLLVVTDILKYVSLTEFGVIIQNCISGNGFCLEM